MAVVGLLLAAFLGFIAYHAVMVGALKSSLKTANESVAQLTVENTTLSEANLQLSKSLETQNAKVTELVEASRAASKEADAAIAKARAESKRWKSKYQDLWNAPRPTGEDCKDLALKIDQYIELRKSEVSP